MTPLYEFAKKNRANNVSAFLAGLVLGILGDIYEYLSYFFDWSYQQRDWFFWPLAIFGFLVPVVVFVVGSPHFSERSSSEGFRACLRMLIWFVGSFVGMLLGAATIGGFLWLLSKFDG